ncbi:MAG: HAMP domain-containing protein, partial [Chloroflexi bacterium]|nr:HAMP domain-containing protein [Chloroflexota bacterium]
MHMRFPRSLQWRIAIAYTVLIFITMGAVSAYLINFIEDRFIEGLENRLAQEATLIGDAVESTLSSETVDKATLSSIVTRLSTAADARVTVMDADALVLADSRQAASGAASPLLRGEIQDVLDGLPIGKEARLDPESGEEFRFVAVPVHSNGVLVGIVRVTAPTSEVRASVNRIIATVGIAAVVVAVLSITLGYYVGHRVSESVRMVTGGARLLAKGDLDHRVTPVGNDESREMAEAFNQMASRIRSMVGDLDQERGRMAAVLETMTDGVLVVDSKHVVVLMNRAAAVMLGLPSVAIGDTLAEVVR